MRVTGGRWCSRQLKGPTRGMPLRPTPDAMRERAFAVLGDRIAGARALDLYAGTGAVGIEALSRGAARVVFVERHPAAVRLVEANLARLGATSAEAVVMVRPARAAVEELARLGERFDLVWADPPFEIWQEGLEVLEAAAAVGLLAVDGIACLECPERADVAVATGLEVLRDLGGGASRVVLLATRGGTQD